MFMLIYYTSITLLWNFQIEIFSGTSLSSMYRLCVVYDIRNDKNYSKQSSHSILRNSLIKIFPSPIRPFQNLHSRPNETKLEIAAKKRVLRGKECFYKFSKWSSVSNRIAYSQLFRTRFRNVIFASIFEGVVSRVVLSIARFFFSLWASWKRAAFCYRRSEQQPRACVFLYIVDVGTSLGRRMGKMALQDRFPSSREIRGPILARHRWPQRPKQRRHGHYPRLPPLFLQHLNERRCSYAISPKRDFDIVEGASYSFLFVS